MAQCVVCCRSIEPLDGVIAKDVDSKQYERFGDRVEDPLPAAGWRYWVHIACTKDAVERWCRAGRPQETPLDWCRKDGLHWTGLQGRATRGRMVLDGPDR